MGTTLIFHRKLPYSWFLCQLPTKNLPLSSKLPENLFSQPKSTNSGEVLRCQKEKAKLTSKLVLKTFASKTHWTKNVLLNLPSLETTTILILVTMLLNTASTTIKLKFLSNITLMKSLTSPLLESKTTNFTKSNTKSTEAKPSSSSNSRDQKTGATLLPLGKHSPNHTSNFSLHLSTVHKYHWLLFILMRFWLILKVTTGSIFHQCLPQPKSKVSCWHQLLVAPSKISCPIT